MSDCFFELVLVLVARVGSCLFDCAPCLLDGVKFRRIGRKFYEAHVVRLAPRGKPFGAVPRPAVEKESQARVTRLQALDEREYACSVNAGEERIMFAFAVDRADRVEFFAGKIR